MGIEMERDHRNGLGVDFSLCSVAVVMRDAPCFMDRLEQNP